MKKLKVSAGILGLILAHKLLFGLIGLNLFENLLNMKLGAYSGFTVENVLLSIAFGLILYFLIERKK